MTAINLASLPAPKIIEALDFENIFSRNKADLIAVQPELENTLQLESEPLTKLIQDWSYKELLLRQRINEAAKAVMMAYSESSDLDHLVAASNVQRLVIQEEDLTTTPPTERITESDTELRERGLLAWESLSTAGPSGAYEFHALSAHALVKHASALGPELSYQNGTLVSSNGIAPGVVVVSVLSREGNGSASADILGAVSERLNRDDTVPLTDYLHIQSAQIIEYQVAAELFLFAGPDSTVVMAEAQTRVTAYCSENHRLGRSITRSGLTAALHAPGVARVDLQRPEADLVCTKMQAAYCTETSVTFGGRSE